MITYKPSILIVEDESITALELKDRLNVMGYHVAAICATGNTALTTVQKVKPDIILMDIILRGKLDGIETAASIRNIADIPILFLTAHSDQKTLARAMRISPFGYILKPFREKELSMTIGLALQHHRMDAAIRKSETRLQAVLSRIGAAVISTDRDGRITFINSAAVKYTGITPEEAAGKKFSTVIKMVSRISRQPVDSTIKKIAEIDSIGHYPDQVILLSADDSEREIEGITDPVRDMRGQVTGYTFIFHDVTEKNRIKESIEHSRKLESLGVITGGIAHNFNNLLTGIFGYVSLAKMHSSPEDACRIYLDNAEKILGKTQNLSRQLLSFSRGGGINKRFNPVKIVKTTTRAVLKETRMQFQLTAAPDLSCIEFDTDQFALVISNIVENSVYATKGSGLIHITCTNATVKQQNSNYPKGEYVQIKISDTGTGIDPEILHNIFDPFYTTEDDKTGIGLSTAYFILRNHHSYISVDSKPDKGTSFTILLPAFPANVTAQSKIP